MKLIGSALLVLSGLGWGLMRAFELGRRVSLLTALYKMMERLKAGIRFGSSPLPDLLKVDESPFCRAAAREPGFQADPCQALLKAGEPLFPCQEDKALFREFVRGLGASDVSGQVGHIQLYAALVSQALSDARERREKGGRLSVSLGLFGGLVLCILLL